MKLIGGWFKGLNKRQLRRTFLRRGNIIAAASAFIIIAAAITVFFVFNGETGRKEPPPTASGITPQPRIETEPTPAAKSTAAHGTNAKAIVVQSVAYGFFDNKGGELYCGIEYENTGDCPIVIPAVSMTFKIGTEVCPQEFEPAAYQYAVVTPGERAYMAFWAAYDIDDKSVSITVEDIVIEAQKADGELGWAVITPENVFLVQNYPRFSTFSCDLYNNSGHDYILYDVVAGCHDKDGNLICVWYFSHSSLLGNGKKTHVTSQMSGLPIEGLADIATVVNVIAHGIY